MVQWWQIVVTVICIVLSGTFSGLTLGLMSLDLIDLRVLTQSGTEKEKWYALRILPVRRHGNWLLCTLLIGNTAVNAGLAIVTADLFGGVAGFLSSTISILYIGEIIPQAVCHRYGLIVGAYAIPIVRFCMYLTAPLSFTTAKLLDYFLGGESATRYNKSQLKSLISMHGRDRSEADLPSLSTTTESAGPTDRVHQVDTVIDLNQLSSSSTPSASVSPVSPISPPDTEDTCSRSSREQIRSAGHQSVHRNGTQHTTRFAWFSQLCSLWRSKKPINPGEASRKQRRTRDKKIEAPRSPLTRDEVAMLDGAFDFSQKTVGGVMTSLDDVFMLDVSLSLNFKLLLLIFQSGHSRIPVYAQSRENIIGLLFAKDLILLDPEDSVPIRTILSFFSRTLLVVSHDTPLDNMLNIFRQGGAHLSLVREHNSEDSNQRTIGVVTLEDLIEELIGRDIVDETDVYTDNLHKQHVQRLRSIDPDVLKMFDSKHDEEILSKKEALAVALYLSNNTNEFSEKYIRLDVLCEMLSELPIIECHGSDKKWGVPDEASDVPPLLESKRGSAILSSTSHVSASPGSPSKEDDGLSESELWDDVTIYSKGVPTKNAYLILHGRLQIIAGVDGFISETGPWNVLGIHALTENLFAPDFTAKVLERPTRLLRISNKHYRLMVQACNMQHRDTISRGEAQRLRNEIRLGMCATARVNRRRHGSSASHSSRSLAVAAAAAAVAVGEASGAGPSIDTSVVNRSRAIRDGQSLEWGEIEAHDIGQRYQRTNDIEDLQEEMELEFETETEDERSCDSGNENDNGSDGGDGSGADATGC